MFKRTGLHDIVSVARPRAVGCLCDSGAGARCLNQDGVRPSSRKLDLTQPMGVSGHLGCRERVHLFSGLIVLSACR